MLKRIINRVLTKFIDADMLVLNYERQKEFNLLKHCVIGESSKFYAESQIVNLQGNRSSIIIGSNTHIRGHLQVFAQGGEISVGDYCYVGEYSKIWSASQIKIGNRVLISHSVNIHDNISHPIDPGERHMDYLRILGLHSADPKSFDLKPKPVFIGDDVWIGFNAVIMKGITIGCGSIVGAGSFVNRDVPENVIVGGNPARIIRHLV